MGIASGNTPWQDFPSTATPITASRLNAIEDALDATVALIGPAPSGDQTGATDTAAISALLASTAGGVTTKTVTLRGGVYWVNQPLSIPAGTTLRGAGNGATTIKLANGANCDVIQSAGLTTWLVAQTSAPLAVGVAVTAVPVSPLARALNAGDTLQLGYPGAGQVATVAAPGAVAGATSVPVASFTPTLTVPTNACVVVNPTHSYTDGVPYGFGLVGVTISGNRDNNTLGHGVAFYGIRYTLDDVYVYQTAQTGIVSAGTLGTTGGYPKGQVEANIGTVWVRFCGGAGFHYEGPHDGYAERIYVASCDGNGVEIGGLDGDYLHSYGSVVGAVIQGSVRWTHLQTENSRKEGLVVETGSPVVNWIGRLTAFDNWQDNTATKDNYSVRCVAPVHIGNAGIKVSKGESGVYLGGTRSRIADGQIIGVNTADTVGLMLNATYATANVDVSNWSTGVQRENSNNVGTTLRAFVSACSLGFYERGASVGSSYDVTVNAISAGHQPWVLAASTATSYRLACSGAIVASHVTTGSGAALDHGITGNQLTANRVAAGETTLPRWGAVSRVTMGTGVVRFSFFTATKTETVNNLACCTGGTAAGATPTYAALGVYSVGADGALTLVASTASDTTLFATGNTTYTRTTLAPWSKVAGQRYAFAALVVSGAAMPSIVSANFSGPSSEMSTRAPILAASLSGQSELPASVAAGALGTSTQMLYGAITP